MSPPTVVYAALKGTATDTEATGEGTGAGFNVRKPIEATLKDLPTIGGLNGKKNLGITEPLPKARPFGIDLPMAAKRTVTAPLLTDDPIAKEPDRASKCGVTVPLLTELPFGKG